MFHAVNGLPDLHPGLLWPQQQFGNLAVGPIIVVVAAARRQWHLAAAAGMATGLKLGLERAVKAVVVRERPGTTVPGAVRRGDVPHEGQSFVSGHATLVTALATVVSPHLSPRWRAAPALAAAAVCLARVYSGAHNPLDVVGGVGLGLVAGGATNLTLGRPVGRPVGPEVPPCSAPVDGLQQAQGSGHHRGESLVTELANWR